VIFGTLWLREQRVRPGCRRPTAAVRTGDDLQQVAVGVVEVDPAPPVPGVDLIAFVAVGISPVGEVPVTNPCEDLVEFVLIYQEGVVLRSDLVLGVVIVQ
jgi:hypothetical protein